MEIWQINPKVSVGPLALNAFARDLEPALGSEYDRFSRGINEVLAYDSLGIHVEIEQDGQVRAISVFLPCQVSLQGVGLLGHEVSKVKRDLDNAGCLFKPVDAGLWSEGLLVMLVEQDGVIDGVEVRRVPY